MSTEVKIIINGVEVTEQNSRFDLGLPYIKDITLYDNACKGSMDIGATASNSLRFTIVNPYKNTFDGDIVQFLTRSTGEDGRGRIAEIIDEVGEEASGLIIDGEDYGSDMEENEENGEDPTQEELDDAEEIAAERLANEFVLLEGEDTAEETIEVVDDEWSSIGFFYVHESKSAGSGESISIICFDGFCLLGGTFRPEQQKDTIQNLYNNLRAQVLEDTGIEIDEHIFAADQNLTVDWNFSCSYRDALGYFAGLVGGFAEFDGDGTVGISFYGYSDLFMLTSDLIGYSEDSSGEMVIEGMQCNVALNDVGQNIIRAGTGQEVAWTNPFVTQDILDTVFASYQGMRITGARLTALWNDWMASGQFVRIFTPEEFADYIKLDNYLSDAPDPERIREAMSEIGKIIMISHQVVSFYGGKATTVITSGAPSVNKQDNMPVPEAVKQIRIERNRMDSGMQSLGEEIANLPLEKYTYYAYAEDTIGTGFSLTESSLPYRGICITSDSEAPAQPDKYKWEINPEWASRHADKYIHEIGDSLAIYSSELENNTYTGLSALALTFYLAGIRQMKVGYEASIDDYGVTAPSIIALGSGAGIKFDNNATEGTRGRFIWEVRDNGHLSLKLY